MYLPSDEIDKIHVKDKARNMTVNSMRNGCITPCISTNPRVYKRNNSSL